MDFKFPDTTAPLLYVVVRLWVPDPSLDETLTA